MRAVRPRSWGRRLSGAVATSAALVLLAPDAAWAEPGVPVPPSELITDKAAGAVTAADKDLVIKVRLAGLWEIPAGEMAQEKSDDERIQEIGRDIAAQHEELDKFDPRRREEAGHRPARQAEQRPAGLAGRDAGGRGHRLRPDLHRPAAGGARQDLPGDRDGPREHPQRHGTQARAAGQPVRRDPHDVAGDQRHRRLQGPADRAGAEREQRPAATAGGNAANQSPVSTTNLPVLLVVLVGGLLVGGFATSRLMGNRRRPYRRW